jgi:hypothetical protein
MKTALPDFKTERSNVLPPLPGIMRLVPLGFYAGLALLAAVTAYSFHSVSALQEEERGLMNQMGAEQAKLKNLNEQRAALGSQVKQAKEVQNWMAGGSEIYPLVIHIARSVDPDTHISNLTLSRVEDSPSHLKMMLKYNSPRGVEQAESITNAISEKLQLRQYSATTTPEADDDKEVVLECNWAPGVVAMASDK